MVEIIHSKATKIAEKTEDQDSFGGALRIDPDEDSGLPERYKLMPISKIDKLFQNEGHPILGRHVGEIEEQLLQRHPSPHKLITKVQRYQGPIRVRRQEERETWRRGKHTVNTWEEKQFNGWFVHENYLTSATSVYELLPLTKLYGALLIPHETFELLGSRNGLADEGFTSSPRKLGLWLINYNPRCTQLGPWRRAMVEYKRRSTTWFPQEFIDALYEHMRINHAGHDCCGFDLSMPPRAARRYSINPVDIRNLDKLNMLLFKERWWRSGPNRREYDLKDNVCTMLRTLSECVQYLHASEAIARKELEEYPNDHCSKNKLWLCGFIRREATACKVPIPAKPKEPKKPKPIRSRKKRKAKRKSRVRKPKE